MNPGKLSRRLTLQNRIARQGLSGDRVESWCDVGPIWAELVEQGQSEALESGAERLTETATFRIRWRSDVSAGNSRVVYRGQPFGIHGVVEDGIKTTLRLMCRALKGLEV